MKKKKKSKKQLAKNKEQNRKLLLVGGAIFLGVFSVLSIIFISQGKINKNLTTSVVGDKIRAIERQMTPIKNCIRTAKWTPSENSVCKYVLFSQENSACDSFDNMPKTRLGIGTKNCCQGEIANTTLCPGDDIFDEANGSAESSLVKSEANCTGDAMCEYYPSEGYHLKDGNVEKDCVEKVISRGRCSAKCGGGTREIKMMTKWCREAITQEICGTKTCDEGWKEL